MSSPSELIQDHTSFNTLQEYQAWAATDWLHEPGSDEGQLHARSKLDEETTELAEAIQVHKPDEILDELGDVLWTATANAHNAGVALEDSFRYSLLEGTFDDNPISIAKIDDMSSEFVAGQTPEETSARLKYLSGYLGKAAKQWHNLSPLIDAQAQPATFSEAWIQLKAGRTKGSLVELVLICSAIAQQECSKSLQDAMKTNAQKLQARKAMGEPLTKLPE